MFFNFLELNIDTFPAGKFYKCKICIEENREKINVLIEDYKELIFTDTPIENRSLDILAYEDSSEKLDLIIQKSILILDKLESYLP